MDLLEYQAKELFQQMGIPVLPSQRISHPKELKDLKVPYPVVLKSQVYAVGRAKAGGIRFVENTIDAVAAAQAIFHLEIMGQYPDVVLAEAKYDSVSEFYLAVVLDCSSRRPLLLGSPQGGWEVESAIEKMQHVVVDQEFSPFYARRLAIKMGLQGELLCSVSFILEKMYRLFVQKDLDLVEINPLAISSTGQVMALDGKVVANDYALHRHDDLAIYQARNSYLFKTIANTFSKVEWVKLEGNIGVLCNGAGLTMATLDLVAAAGGKPAGFVNLGGECRHDLPPDILLAQIEQGLDIMTQHRGIKAVLVHLVGTVVSCAQIATAIASHLRHRPLGQSAPALIVRLTGREVKQAKEILFTLEVVLADNLDVAIAQAISVAKAKP